MTTVYDKVYRFAQNNPEEFWGIAAEQLYWNERWEQVRDDSTPPFYRWFVGGSLNTCYNCLDRHIDRGRGKQLALIYDSPVTNTLQHFTYTELRDEVARVAGALKTQGVAAGDRVILYMPMIPEAVIGMLACARIGAVHSVVFGGFAAKELATRIDDAKPTLILTASCGIEGDRVIPYKPLLDEAIELATHQPKHVLISQRPQVHAALVPGRDLDWLDTCQKSEPVDCVPVSATDPLYILYTSGTTGVPKGVVRDNGGHAVALNWSMEHIYGVGAGEVYWAASDIGWVVGHSYIVYGPLAVGATGVLYEGVPNFPDAGRPWRIAERLGVNIFHTAPTTIRMLRKSGPDEPDKYDYHFKHMTTVGEPIEPEVWRWYYEVVGKREAAIVDTWWQTETGGFIGTTLPGLQPMKPGSCGPGALGIYPVVLDENGQEVEAGRGGNICISNPWPGFMQTIWGDPDRFVETYFARYNKDPDSKDWRDWPYMTGDGAMKSEDGYYRIVGRIDDVINVAGHRLGTKELESATLTVESVGEAAAGPAYDELKGRIPEIYVSLKPGYEPDKVEADVRTAIRQIIGPIATPGAVWVSADLPKTRSGKSMRGVIAASSNFIDVGDTTTLANPEIVEEIRQSVQGAKVKAGMVPEGVPESAKEEFRRFGEDG